MEIEGDLSHVYNFLNYTKHYKGYKKNLKKIITLLTQ